MLLQENINAKNGNLVSVICSLVPRPLPGFYLYLTGVEKNWYETNLDEGLGKRLCMMCSLVLLCWLPTKVAFIGKWLPHVVTIDCRGFSCGRSITPPVFTRE